jgi:uncharacterized protein YjbI with pentapeptide repeats
MLVALALTMALNVAPVSAKSTFRDCSDIALTPGADLHRCDYAGSSAFQGQDIHGANLSKSSLVLAHAGGDPDVPPANFANVNLRRAVAWHADLSDTILISADLRRGDFSEASFEDATLMDALMSRGNFTNASFHFANLKGADLVRANLSGAAMTRTYLVNANLRHVKGLESAVGLDTATFGNTICPDGRNSDRVGGTCVGHLRPWRRKVRLPWRHASDVR